MTAAIAKVIWGVCIVAWYLIRYPHARRARRNQIARDRRGFAENILLAISTTGLFLVPLAYVVSGFPSFADYTFAPVQGWLGGLMFLASLWLFHRTHRDLGRNWSISLRLREGHKLVTEGVYRHLRHPMYAAFWLWAIAQCFLLPNWIAGPAGLVGFGTLFFCRVSREEALMIENFGEDYRAYMRTTARVVPWNLLRRALAPRR
jgi:protein-S-isoprenylcysteine O-methyltransferase Ste14